MFSRLLVKVVHFEMISRFFVRSMLIGSVSKQRTLIEGLC